MGSKEIRKAALAAIRLMQRHAKRKLLVEYNFSDEVMAEILRIQAARKGKSLPS